MLDNIPFAKETSKWLMIVIELSLPRVGNEEYQCRLSRHYGGTLWSIGRRCQRQPSGSLGTCRFLDLLVTNLPSAKHSEIWV